MDPFTLFALANGAVSAVKAGCKLYKDIKGAAGEVKDILKDLDDQFKKQYEGKPVPPEARKQLNEEKQRVRELNKADSTDVYAQIGESLGAYFENMAKIIAIFEEEEKRSQEVYTGEMSLGKRALQRVLIRSKLEAMTVELREVMVYQSPPELGDLYTRVQAMMEKISAEQSVAIGKKMQQERLEEQRRKARADRLWMEIAIGLTALFLTCCVAMLMVLVVEDRIKKYPHLGQDFIPHNENKKKPEYTYIGR